MFSTTPPFPCGPSRIFQPLKATKPFFAVNLVGEFDGPLRVHFLSAHGIVARRDGLVVTRMTSTSRNSSRSNRRCVEEVLDTKVSSAPVRCGAVQAALEEAPSTDSLAAILDEIRPALRGTPPDGGDRLDAAVRANTVLVAKALVARSETLRSRAQSGNLLVVPLLYDLKSGQVEQLRQQ